MNRDEARWAQPIGLRPVWLDRPQGTERLNLRLEDLGALGLYPKSCRKLHLPFKNFTQDAKIKTTSLEEVGRGGCCKR